MFSKPFVGVILLAAAMCPLEVSAENAGFSFNGAGVSGTLVLSYQVNPNVGPLPKTAPNPVDPVGSFIITGITGIFSDVTLGIANATITGLVPLNRVSPDATNLLAPNSFSLLPVLNGVPSPDGVSLGLHYNNLLYPAGSPQAASDYPFAGGVFDIYGIVFGIGGGNVVNLWSNGNVPGSGLNYGVAVTDQVDLLYYVGGISVIAVPEPGTWGMLLLGIGTVGLALRHRQKVTMRISYAA